MVNVVYQGFFAEVFDRAVSLGTCTPV